MKVTIHEVTFTVGFNSEDSMLSAEMAAMLVRECEWAAHKVNEYFQPSKPITPIPDCSVEPDPNEVGHDDPF